MGHGRDVFSDSRKLRLQVRVSVFGPTRENSLRATSFHSVTRIIFHDASSSKRHFEDWHSGISNEARPYAVRKFFKSISDSKVTFVKDLKTYNLLDYAEKLEKDL